MKQALLIIGPVLALTACGGGGGGTPTVVPPPVAPASALSAFGYADPSNPTDQIDFSFEDVRRVVIDTNNNGSFAQSDIRIADDTYSGVISNNTITVTIDGVDYELTPNGPRVTEYLDGTSQVRLTVFSTSNPDATPVEVLADINGVLNSSALIVGYDTDPNVVEAKTGTSTYTGISDIALRRGRAAGFGSGTATLNVNFNNDTINGVVEVDGDSATDPDLEFTAFTVTLEQADIESNGFAGSIRIREDGASSDFPLAQNSYEGRFYGVDGTSVGGLYSGQIDQAGSNDLFFEGYFLAPDPP